MNSPEDAQARQGPSVVSQLKAANCEFKIHSSNRKNGVEEIIWGSVGGFAVGKQTGTGKDQE